MLLAYDIGANANLHRIETADGSLPADIVWVDLVAPTRDEERLVESFLGLSIPTLEEAQEIEYSSRFYEEDGGIFFTASITAGVEDGKPDLTPLTFILAGNRLTTVRYRDFRSMGQFLSRAVRTPGTTNDGASIMLGLLEAIIDRQADVVERCGVEIDRTNQQVFARRGSPARRSRDLEGLISDIGTTGDLIGKVRECLSSLERLLQYANAVAAGVLANGRVNKNRLKLMQRDIRSLADHITFLNAKVAFLLDATLGLISVQQNEVIRLLAIVSVFFFPPMLIASIYGMNFDFMPELSWPFGYPLAIGAMVATVAGPYVYFKRRGWL